MLDVLLKMRHEDQVSRLEPVIMEGVVVNVSQDGASSKPVGFVFVINVFAQFVHDLEAGHDLWVQFALKEVQSDQGGNISGTL